MRAPLPKPSKHDKKLPKALKRTRMRIKPYDPLWFQCRMEWFEENPPNFEGYYQCALCPYMVLATETTLDHIETRSSHPHLKYVKSNLQPAHLACNTRRGSMTMEWYRDAYPELMRVAVPA